MNFEVLLGSCKHIKSYDILTKRWFGNITFLKFRVKTTK